MTRTHRRREEWLSLIADYEQSGQTQTAFCGERGLNPKYFSLKRGQLTQEVTSPSDSSAGFVRVTTASHAGMKLRIGAVCLEMPADFSLDTLSRLMLTLA
ncbi:MAG: hypothetical protein OEY38_22740 [Gammaproteobacteria bacterium]|nr:hypothetical protein [Gammaproteobacteria bacterium]